jgi:hypothetical protein
MVSKKCDIRDFYGFTQFRSPPLESEKMVFGIPSVSLSVGLYMYVWIYASHLNGWTDLFTVSIPQTENYKFKLITNNFSMKGLSKSVKAILCSIACKKLMLKEKVKS